jgi:uncharacterized protein YggE
MMTKHGPQATGGAVDGPSVAVTGTGRVRRPADIAQATFVVEGIRDTAAEARAEAATAAADVLGALAGVGVKGDDVHTAGIDVSPNWEHDGNRSVRRGFTVTNRIAATIRDLEQVGTVLDAALASGATGLDGVTFQLAQPGPAETEARRLAVEDAHARATTIAAAAGMTLGRLVGIAEGGAPVPLPRREMRMAAMAADAAAPTPVLPGTLEVAVSVTAEWELSAG